jgi:hypothetical protein
VGAEQRRHGVTSIFDSEQSLCWTPCAYFSNGTINPIVPENIATVVSQPRTFIGRRFFHRPMICLLLVISITITIRNGVENPCAIAEYTRAFIGLSPKELRHVSQHSTLRPGSQCQSGRRSSHSRPDIRAEGSFMCPMQVDSRSADR